MNEKEERLEKFFYDAIQGESKYGRDGNLNEKIKNAYPNSYPHYAHHINRLKALAKISRCIGFAGLEKQIVKDYQWTTFKNYNPDEQAEAFKNMTHIKKKNGWEIQLEWKGISLKAFADTCEIGIKEFIAWYIRHLPGDQTKCEYCQVTEEKCRKYMKDIQNDGGNKRHRGKQLELERKDSKNNLYNEKNCIWICHICNNAKSDIFSEKDFREFIVPGIQEFWKRRS